MRSSMDRSKDIESRMQSARNSYDQIKSEMAPPSSATKN